LGGAATPPCQKKIHGRVSKDAPFLSQRDYVIQPKVGRAAGYLGSRRKWISTLKEMSAKGVVFEIARLPPQRGAANMD